MVRVASHTEIRAQPMSRLQHWVFNDCCCLVGTAGYAQKVAAISCAEQPYCAGSLVKGKADNKVQYFGNRMEYLSKKSSCPLNANSTPADAG